MLTNLYGEDREDAIAAMDDDEKFDQWTVEYERKKAREMASRQNGGGGAKAGRVSVSKDDFIAATGGGGKDGR